MKKEGYILELIDYIKKNLRKGYTKDSLRWALINQGHSRIEVEKAMRIVEQELADEAPLLRTKPDITYEVLEPVDAVIEKKPWWKRWIGI